MVKIANTLVLQDHISNLIEAINSMDVRDIQLAMTAVETLSFTAKSDLLRPINSIFLEIGSLIRFIKCNDPNVRKQLQLCISKLKPYTDPTAKLPNAKKFKDTLMLIKSTLENEPNIENEKLQSLFDDALKYTVPPLSNLQEISEAALYGYTIQRKPERISATLETINRLLQNL